MLQPLKEEAFALISNALKKGGAFSYLHLSLPVKTGKKSTKT
jgi:hypothetical protein